MTKKKVTLSIGLVGLGYWGPNWLRNILQHTDYSLAWVVDNNPKSIQKFQSQYGLTSQQLGIDLLSKLKENVPDLVLIATPPSTHLELGGLVINAGANLIVEKPIGLQTSETIELLNLSKSKNVKIFADHTYLFTPQAKKIYELINNKDLGELQFIFSSRLNLGLIRNDVDVIRDLAVHDLALFDYFLKKIPTVISTNSVTHHPAQIPSTASLNLSYEGNLLAQIFVSWNSPVKVRNMIISGSNKSILWDDVNQSEKIKVYEASANSDLSDSTRQISYSLGSTLIPKVDTTEAIKLELDHVRDVLHHNIAAINGYDHILRITKVLKALEERSPLQGMRVNN
jgi:predicted dehydrogenase